MAETHSISTASPTLTQTLAAEMPTMAVPGITAPPAQLDSLIESFPDAVLCFDAGWRITYANREARRISRITPGDFNSKTHWELFPETVGLPIEHAYRRAMTSRLPGSIQHYYAPYEVWLDIQIVPIDSGIALSYRDITKRKLAELRAESANSLLEQVFAITPDSIIGVDQQWKCSFFNQAASNKLGLDDLTGMDIWAYFALDDHPEFAANLRRTMDQRLPTDFEAFYAEPLSAWYRVSTRPYEDGIIIFSSDISDRKRAEAARDASIRHHQQVLEATTDGVVSLAPDWTITYLNQQANTILGREDLVGRNLWQEFPLAVNTEFYKRYCETMNDRTPCEFEAFYPDPLNIWFRIQSRPSDDGIVVFFRDVTAERAAKESLLEQQATLTFVQQTARVATWIIDLETGAMSIGDGSYPVFGRPNQETTSVETFRDLVHPDDRAHVRESSRASIEGRTTNSVDFRIIAPDGSIRWLEGRGLAVYDEQGEATHLRGMTSDITARKQNEERLATSEARYRVLTDLNPQALWMGDPAGRITYANQGFADYTGIPITEDVGDGWLDAFDPLDLQRVISAWTRSVQTGDEYNVEARLIRASDRASRWWNLRGLPVRDAAGTILYWLGVAVDIHELRIAAEELRQKQIETERQRAELETVYRTAPVGLGLFDPNDFRYLRLNDRLAEIIGLPMERIVGRTLSEIAPTAAFDVFQKVVADRAMQHQLIEGEFPGRPGETRFFNVNYAPVFAPDGSIQAIATATLDITQQKKSETALVQSEKLAAVGRLASSISHEINNPLEAITNLLYLTGIDPDLPESVRTYVHMAQAELSRVSQIATQTLRFHRQAVRRTFVTSAELVDAVLRLYQGRLSNSGIQIQARYNSTTPIYCFENDIRQVLNNLIANSIDAMRSGGRIIARAHDVSGTNRSGGRRGVRITIADTGHGMSAATKARIFEPFYTTKELNGTGLGLWISAGIISRHDGTLTVRTSQHPLHHGTVFTLFLPTD